MPAVIESTLYDAPPPGGVVVPGSTQQNSRDDLRLGYHVVLHSVQAATTYSWTLAFASDSPGSTVPGTPFDGTSSASALLAPEGSTSQDAKFNVDYEGTYLIRLTVDVGLPTEDTQFIRCRVLTLFGDLKLVAAGERRDELGVIPVDATPEGWANDQNANFQRIAVLLRRLSTSGRILYVDANRGRDSAAVQDDYDNVISIPGPELAREEETGIKLRAMAHGDFSSINSAISYAAAAAARGEPVLSKTDPYFIVIRPGFYNEDLNLVSFVHLVGDQESSDSRVPNISPTGPQAKPVIVRTLNTGGVGTHVYNPQAASSVAECFLFNLHLENTVDTANPVLKQQGGLVKLTQCVVRQQGDAANQGPAIQCLTANAAHAPQLWLKGSRVTTEATTADRSAIYFDAPESILHIEDSLVDAESCVALTVNPTLYENSQCHVLSASLVAGLSPFQGYPSLLHISYSSILASGNPPAQPALAITPPGGVGAKPGSVLVELNHVVMTGVLQFKTTNAVGTTSLTQSSVTHTRLTVSPVVLTDAPGDMPDSIKTYTRSDTLWYVTGYADWRDGPAAVASIPVPNQVVEEDVQRILDLLWLGTFPVTGSPFYSLSSAYNGLTTISPFTPGVGLGRNIDALGGAVQIQGSTFPTGQENHLKYGGLQVEGIIDIGGFINGAGSDTIAMVGGSEIFLNPNMTGSGPFIGLGRATWPNGVTQPDRGFAGASLVAGGSQTMAGTGAYHLHLRTTDLRAPNTGKTGNIYMVSGALGDAASVDSAGEVHVIAGSHANPAGTVGNLWLVPGNTETPSTGVIWFVGAPDAGAGALRAALTPLNAFVGGVAGTIVFGTPTGTESITFTGLEANAAAAAVVVNAQARGIRAADVGGQLVVYSEYGPAGDLLYLGDSTGGTLNTALGNYILGAGAVFTPGVYGDKVSVDVPLNGRLRINGSLEVTGALVGGTGGVSIYQDTAAALYNVALGSGIEVLGVQLVPTVDTAVVLDAAEPTGRTITIKDESGIADAIPSPGGQMITISDGGGALFDGATPLNITTAYGSLTLYKNVAGNWSII